MQNSTKALLWVFLVFLIGTAFGAAVVKLSQRSRLVADGEAPPTVIDSGFPGSTGEPVRKASPEMNRGQPVGLSGNVLERMLGGLSMNQEQTVLAREILESARTDYTRIEQRWNLQQRRVRNRALRELREILNPRQRRQLRQFLSQLQARRRS